MNLWRVTNTGDQVARQIADRHYNRQKIGNAKFVPPGRSLVLISETYTGKALWITSYPFAEYVLHEWAGAWICSLFRNEGAAKASELIRDAILITRDKYDIPELGMITFIDSSKVKPIKKRGVLDIGQTFERVGFEYIGMTKKKKLWVFQLSYDKILALHLLHL